MRLLFAALKLVRLACVVRKQTEHDRVARRFQRPRKVLPELPHRHCDDAWPAPEAYDRRGATHFDLAGRGPQLISLNRPPNHPIAIAVVGTLPILAAARILVNLDGRST